MKKRSKGVTIFGILLILSCLFQMLGLTKADTWKLLFQPLPEGIVYIRFLISVIVLILGVISGIGVLFLKDIFRKIALFLGFFALYAYLIEAPFFTFRNMPQFIKQAAMHAAATIPGVVESTYSLVLWTTMIISWIIDLGFAICLIYFFTRTKVKAQFK